MTTGLEFNDDASRKIEALYLTPEVTAQRCAIHKLLDPRAGEHILDIGSGPGLLAQELAASVGPSGRLCGVDLSEPMLAMARKRCAEMSWTEFKAGDATKLPIADASFDAAVVTQVYEYVADIPAALAELHRVLKSGGRALIIDTDYDSFVLNRTDEALTKRILGAWDAHFVHRGLPRTLSAHLIAAGFQIRTRDVIPMFNPEYNPNTFGYRLLHLMADFAVGRGAVTLPESRAWLEQLHELGRRNSFFFSINRYVFLVGK